MPLILVYIPTLPRLHASSSFVSSALISAVHLEGSVYKSQGLQTDGTRRARLKYRCNLLASRHLRLSTSTFLRTIFILMMVLSEYDFRNYQVILKPTVWCMWESEQNDLITISSRMLLSLALKLVPALFRVQRFLFEST